MFGIEILKENKCFYSLREENLVELKIHKNTLIDTNNGATARYLYLLALSSVSLNEKNIKDDAIIPTITTAQCLPLWTKSFMFS